MNTPKGVILTALQYNIDNFRHFAKQGYTLNSSKYCQIGEMQKLYNRLQKVPPTKLQLYHGDIPTLMIALNKLRNAVLSAPKQNNKTMQIVILGAIDSVASLVIKLIIDTAKKPQQALHNAKLDYHLPHRVVNLIKEQCNLA